MNWIRALQMFADSEEDYNRLLDSFIKYNECPRCENGEIKSEQNYCQICGFEVRELNEIKYKEEQ